MSSILTNNGAMVALQTLKSVNSNLADTQSQISTGKAVSDSKQNAAVWAISKPWNPTSKVSVLCLTAFRWVNLLLLWPVRLLKQSRTC